MKVHVNMDGSVHRISPIKVDLPICTLSVLSAKTDYQNALHASHVSLINPPSSVTELQSKYNLVSPL